MEDSCLALQAQYHDPPSCAGDERTFGEVPRKRAFMGFTTCHTGLRQRRKTSTRFVSDEATSEVGAARLTPPAGAGARDVAEPPRQPPCTPQAAVILLREALRGAHSSPRAPSRPQPGRGLPSPGENTGAASSPSSAPHAAPPLHPEPALVSGERLPTRSRFAAAPGITHYLPQANVARDGQSERQCNVLHRLSHGSVQKPANTEVPPPADPAATGAREGGYGNPAGPRPPGRHGNALSERAVAPGSPALHSFH